MRDGTFIQDPLTGEVEFVFFEDLDDEIKTQLIKPVGGFCYEVNELKYLPVADTPFYIQGWLPKMGKMIIYAPPKSGKSFLSTQMARCLGSGIEFLGMPTTKARTLLIQCELGVSVFRKRLINTPKDYSNMYVGTTFSMKLDTPAGQEYLMKAMTAVEPEVLIIDPLYKVMMGEENDTTDVRKILDFLDTLIEAFNCSVVLIHHPGKDLKKRARGSSVLEGWVDSLIEMKRTTDEEKPELRVKFTPRLLRHAELPPEPFLASMVDFEFEIEETEPIQTVESKIRAMGDRQKIISPSELLKSGIGSNTSVYEALSKLQKKGVIRKVGWGQYEFV